MNAKYSTVACAATMLAAGIILAGCSKSQPPPESTASQPPKEETPAQPATPPAMPPLGIKPGDTASSKAASKVPGAAVSTKELLAPAKLKEKAPDTYQVKFDTTRGVFTVTVTRAWAPLEADRFYNLVKHHFYDNAAFFRVVPNFVVQFGISANPSVNSAWQHVTMKDDPVVQSNKRGTIVFAQTSNPNSRGTQVFINLKDNAPLDHSGQGFAPFGLVDGKGMNVVEMMYDGYGDSAGPDQDQLEKQGDPYLLKGWPKLDHIKSATLVESTN